MKEQLTEAIAMLEKLIADSPAPGNHKNRTYTVIKDIERRIERLYNGSRPGWGQELLIQIQRHLEEYGPTTRDVLAIRLKYPYSAIWGAIELLRGSEKIHIHEYRRTGSGRPSTVFALGLGPDAREEKRVVERKRGPVLKTGEMLMRAGTLTCVNDGLRLIFENSLRVVNQQQYACAYCATCQQAYLVRKK